MSHRNGYEPRKVRTTSGTVKLERPRVRDASVDPARESPQRIDVGWDGELVEMLSLPREQANIKLLATEIEPGVQHVKRASLVLRGW